MGQDGLVYLPCSLLSTTNTVHRLGAAAHHKALLSRETARTEHSGNLFLESLMILPEGPEGESEESLSSQGPDVSQQEMAVADARRQCTNTVIIVCPLCYSQLLRYPALTASICIVGFCDAAVGIFSVEWTPHAEFALFVDGISLPSFTELVSLLPSSLELYLQA